MISYCSLLSNLSIRKAPRKQNSIYFPFLVVGVCFVSCFVFFLNPDASLKQCKLYQMSSSPFACAIQPFQETSQLKPCAPTASFPKADVHKSGDEVHSNKHRFLSCISKTQTCKHKSNKAKFLLPSRERTVPRPALLRADKTLLLATRKKWELTIKLNPHQCRHS